MKLDNTYFGNRLIKAIRLGFLIHNLVVFSSKRKKHNFGTFSHNLA